MSWVESLHTDFVKWVLNTYTICAKEVGHKNMLDKIAHIWELHDMYTSSNVTRII